MKKNLLAATIVLFIFISVTGCGSNTHDTQVQTVPVDSSKKVSDTIGETKENLKECFSLIGRDDESAALLLGGGKESIVADGVTPIGRTYTVQLFGEKTEIGTLYDENGRVSIITVELKDPDASVYSDKLKELYGEPTEMNDKMSEGGATWEAWDIEEIQLRLYQQYELSTIEIVGLSDVNATRN